MSREAGGLLVTVTGVVAVRLVLSGRFLSYLQPGMRWPLTIAGLVMIVLGAATLLGSLRGGSQSGDGDGAAVVEEATADRHHHHAGIGPRVSWLLALPVLAVLVVAPAPLGADAARRESDIARVAPVANAGFAPLAPPRDGAVDLTMNQFLARAYYDEEDSLAGQPIRLTGFVVNDTVVPDGYQLTRFQLSCCAADAFAVQVAVHGAPPLADDTWVEVVGEWVPPDDPTARGVDRGADIALASAQVVPAPENPYE
jgi:uncharacterized repeat protein (TIGR03943 family)